jgi:hypothetical protein
MGGTGSALLLTHTPPPLLGPHALLLPPAARSPPPAAPHRVHVIRGSGFVDLHVRGAPVRVVGSAWTSYPCKPKHVSPCHHWRPPTGISFGNPARGLPNGTDTERDGSYFNCDDFWQEHWTDVGQMVEGAERAVVLATHAPPRGIMDRRGGSNRTFEWRVGDKQMQRMLKEVSRRLWEPPPAAWDAEMESGPPPAVITSSSTPRDGAVLPEGVTSRYIVSSEPLRELPNGQHLVAAGKKASAHLIPSEPAGGKPSKYLVSSDTPGADLPAEWSLAVRAPSPAPTGSALATPAADLAPPCTTLALAADQPAPPSTVLAPTSTMLAPRAASPPAAPSTPASWDDGELSSSEEGPRRPKLLLHVFGHVHAKQVRGCW